MSVTHVQSTTDKALNAADLIAGIQRPDFNVISRWVPSGAHVLERRRFDRGHSTP